MSKILQFTVVLLWAVVAAFGQTPIFSDGFETGDFSAWDYVSPSNTAVVSDPTGERGGKVARIYYVICGNPQVAPTLGQTAGGSLGARTYYVVYTYTNATGESMKSPEASLAVSANNLLTVIGPLASPQMTGWNVYVSTTSGDYSTGKQNAGPTPIGTDWTEPVGGLIVGTSPPVTNTAGCGSAHQDRNLWFEYIFSNHGYPNGISHVFVRGYTYQPSPEAGGSTNIQRKLYYFKGAYVSGQPKFNLVFVTFDMKPAVMVRPCSTTVYPGATDCDQIALWFSPQPTLEYNRWYALEIEVQHNSAPGVADGIVRVWIDGVKVLDRTDVYTRGVLVEPDSGYARVEIGRQADRDLWRPVEEYRYWDDIVIGDAYVGP